MRRKSVFEDKQPCEEEDAGLWEQLPGTRKGHGGSPYLSLGSRINLVRFWLPWTIWYLHLINVIEKLYLSITVQKLKAKWTYGEIPFQYNYHAKAYKSPIKNLTWRGKVKYIFHLICGIVCGYYVKQSFLSSVVEPITHFASWNACLAAFFPCLASSGNNQLPSYAAVSTMTVLSSNRRHKKDKDKRTRRF